jgi:hypothetical protein
MQDNAVSIPDRCAGQHLMVHALYHVKHEFGLTGRVKKVGSPEGDVPIDHQTRART